MSTETMEVRREPETHPEVAPVAAQPEGGGPLSRPAVRFGLAGAVILIIVGSVAAWLYYRNRVSTDDAQVDSHISPVASKAYGSVAEVLVNDNQKVKAGDVLVRLDPRDLQARVNQARAALQFAQSQAQAAHIAVPFAQATTTSGVSAAEADAQRARLSYDQSSTADVAYAQANVEKSRATADRAHADLERMRPLAAKAEISALQLDSYVAAARVADSELHADEQKVAQAQRNVEIARSAVTAAEARLAQSRATTQQVGARTADAAAAQAGIAQARANLETAELQLGYATIVAPVDGVVSRRSVERGQIVQPGQGLMAIVPLEDAFVIANFKETQMADVRVGQRAEVNVDTYGKKLRGHVESISGASGALLSLLPPENATGNFVKVVQRIPVKIVFDEKPDDATPLRPGMGVDATIFVK